ncbi:MAG: hypothetical protein LBG77_07275, partial [Dysgonamonadaceae bacterium]|nr:hypothetical protein [Dysgonamonadaceae bacterium]
AIAKNPQWLIDSHANWTKIYSRHFSGSNNPQYAYNQIDDLLYIVPDEKSIIVYNPVTNTENIIPVKAGYPAGISTNALIYDSIHNELISYSLDERTLSRFSFQTRTWSKKTPCATETRFWHHTASYNPKDTSLVTFGGYGYYKYKNDCFKINLNNNTWDKNNLLTITPRYSSASAIVDNCLYVFGGRGSETGKQEVNPHCRYDFYRIDLASNSVELLWNSQAEINFLPCGNMIFNTGDSCFYVLTNLHNGVLFRINSREPELTPVSAGINQNLMADFAFYTLFYSSQYQKLYSLFATNYKAGTSDITFYEMDYPPLSQLEISQTASGAKNYSYNGIILIVAAAIVLLFLIFYLSGRNKRKKSASTGNIQAKTRIPIRESIIEIENIQLPKNRIFDRSKQCISLLGGFNVWDKNGEDITPIFTPILKSLLLLILLYSEQESKGINDKKIDNILWPDKDDKAARNNRNVSLTRLKTLLENVGDVSLINNNGFWKIAFDGNVFCDYHAAIQSIKAIKNKEAGTQMQTELIELLMYGPLLPYTQTDWTDKFKSSYSNDAIDILYNMLIAQEIAQNEELCLQIADTIFLFDSLNEEALKIKCSILYHAGKKGLAKAAYDIFVKEYRSLLGENYKYTLSQLLGV